jgi:proton glutamate symport protein
MVAALRKIPLTAWILIAMFVGFGIGYLWPEFGKSLDPLSSTIFMRLIKSLISPLIFSTLVVGIAGHCDDLRRMGRLALKAFIYFEVVTTLALFIGLAAVNISQPGNGVKTPSSAVEIAQATAEAGKLAKNQATATSFLEHVFPASVVEAAAKNEVLQLVFWSILFGIALAQTPDKYRILIVDFLPTLDVALAESESVLEKLAALVLDLCGMFLGLKVEKQGRLIGEKIADGTV